MANSTDLPKVVHYLISESEGRVVAHCLDSDIVASAMTKKEAERRLDLLVANYFEGLLISMSNGKSPWFKKAAPSRYWERYCSGKPLPTRKLHIRIPELFLSESIQSEIGVMDRAA